MFCLHATHENERGQIALIVLLLMTVGLTLGISLSSRTIMDVSLSRQQQEGTQTFNAAESGVEEALSLDFSSLPSGATTGSINVNGVPVDYSVTPTRSLEITVEEGGVVQINTAGMAAGQTITIHWGKNDDCADPSASNNGAALLMRVYNLTAGTYTAKNYGVSACTNTNSFPLGSLPTETGYLRRYTYTTVAGDQMMSIHPLYNDTTLKVAGTAQLPVQYYRIQSTATNNQGNEVKRVQLDRTIPVYPSVLDYVLYSGTTIQKL